MSRIFVIGATGGVGHRLLPLLIEQGHEVTALHRKTEQADTIKASGAKPVQGDIMSLQESDYRQLLKDHDTIIFSAGAAGSGEARTSKIDGETPALLTDLAEEMGIPRFYLVSAFPEAGRTKGLGDGFEHYMKVKKQADSHLVKSTLNWVILRPGTLLHEETDNGINLDYALPYGAVKRGNVARVLAELVATPSISRQILELTDGANDITDSVLKFSGT